MKVWVLCEAFTLTGDDFGHKTVVHKSLSSWCLPCESREIVMRELKKAVSDSVATHYAGLDNVDEDIESDIRAVLAGETKLIGRDRYEYRYSASDREICWRVYPCEVMRR